MEKIKIVKKQPAKYLTKLAQAYVQSLQADGLIVRQAFIFGSRVTGQHHADSDLDIAIVSSGLDNSVATSQYLLSQAHALKQQRIVLEPHGFHPTEFVDENPLVWEIKQSGVRVK